MKKLFLALFTMLFVSTSIFAQSDLQVLAVVKYDKSESITVRQLKKIVANYELQTNRKLSVEERKEVLNKLISEKLISQAADKLGIAVTDSMVDEFYLMQLSQYSGMPVTEQAFEAIVMQQFGLSLDEFFNRALGMNKKEFKEQIKNTIKMQQYVMTVKQDELVKVAPTDEQIRIFYEANKSQFVWKDMAKVFLVGVPKGDNAGAARIKINEMRNNIVNKKVTADQLKIQAKKENSGFIAEDGIVEKSELGAKQLELSLKELLGLFSQEPGFTSDVIESDEGYLFVTILKKFDAKMLGIGDIIQPETTNTVYDFIKSTLTNSMRQQFLTQALIEIAEDLNTPDSVEMKKTGDALDKLLSWGD